MPDCFESLRVRFKIDFIIIHRPPIRVIPFSSDLILLIKQHTVENFTFYMYPSELLARQLVKKVNARTRKHNTARGATLLGERTTAQTAVFTGMRIYLPCQKEKREVTRAGFELATLRL